MNKDIPFEFVVERLSIRSPFIRPMFGAYAIYVDGKLVLMLRNKETHPADNGLWVATAEEHHESLKAIFPNMRRVRLLGKKSAWQNLPSSADDFEEAAVLACELVLKNDVRIGKVVPPRKKKAAVRKR